MEKPIFAKGEDIPEYEENFNSGTDGGGDCGCFRIFGFKRRRMINDDDNGIDERSSLCSRDTLSFGSAWWAKKMNKVKEFSEVIAGPQWKNFLRKIGAYCSGGRRRRRHRHQVRCQYDPQSYALNFDNGGGEEEEQVRLVAS